jgi:hypothetical protein
MAVMEGTRSPKTWIGEYSFAVDGGAVSTITLRSQDGPIPNGSQVTSGVLDVTTLFTTSAGATGAIQVNAANDVVSATIVSGAPYSTTGNKTVIPVATGATAIKTTAARNPAFVIGTGAVTAGAFKLTLYYV